MQSVTTLSKAEELVILLPLCHLHYAVVVTEFHCFGSFNIQTFYSVQKHENTQTFVPGCMLEFKHLQNFNTVILSL